MTFIPATFHFKKRYIVYSLIFLYIVMCQSCMTMRFSNKETSKFFAPSKIEFQDKTIAFEGYKIHYVETGNAQNPTLFFVHGSPGSWNAFKEYLKDTLLLKKYRMIAIDRPGFGYSDFGDAQNLREQSQRISEFIKKTDNKKPLILVGHSVGGPVVAQLAADNPSWYKRLVILAGSLDPKAENPEKWRTVIKAKPLRYLIPGALRPSNDELWWLKQDLVALEPELKKITCAVTIIHGTKDVLVPYSNVAFMQKKFTNAKSIDAITIKKANHFIPWSYYEIIRNILLKM
ncbi:MULTISPECIES: alpha/beta fold hydrolase [unclassified Flavobacterium]|uniref:alpha/beta fold hydrolase n=1 Tax=unclassified Flavobacterium TaxID=196869 RepID=UPI000F84D01D|nr:MULTISPECIES: alpha/beta hydrolase [unclassified Flavobacterium]RTY64571.1 alpha/beta hydrolase [Flavobacterium sp. LB2P53]RTY74548.1 alpha/beta hydrolase [Flavobacterium sp. LS1R10]RTZ03978.1 alpha/beta hydrolase [Flavobacterium sp. GSP6]